MIGEKVTLNFDTPTELSPRAASALVGTVGLYFIATKSIAIRYPFGSSRLIYIGMSEKPSNSIGKRLQDHYEGLSGNFGLINYRKVDKLLFTHLNFNALRHLWSRRIEELESFFILKFVEKYGVYPICNNKTGFPDLDEATTTNFEVIWSVFDE